MEKKVKMFSLSTCPHCKKAKAYLSEKGIAFENVDVRENKEGAKELMEVYNSKSVPVVVIGDEVIVGFDQQRIDAALGLS